MTEEKSINWTRICLTLCFALVPLLLVKIGLDIEQAGPGAEDAAGGYALFAAMGLISYYLAGDPVFWGKK